MNLRAQQAAYDALAGRCGAVVALDVKTGKLLVSASSPSYNPNLVEGKFDLICKIQAPCTRPDRAVQPGDEGPLPAGLDLQGRDGLRRARVREVHPRLDVLRPGLLRGLRQAGQQLRHDEPVRPRQPRAGACSTRSTRSSATSARRSARRRSSRSRRSSASTSSPPLETPADERAASGLYKDGELFDPTQDFQVDPGRYAFGQERNLVSPIQMAMVAAGIANDGVVMEPYVVDRIVAPDGKVVRRTRPRRAEPRGEQEDGGRDPGHDAPASSRAAPAPRPRSPA